MGDEEGAEGGRDHGRDEREQPDRCRLAGLDPMAYDHEVRHGHGGDEPDDRTGGEQDGVQGDGRPGSDPVLAHDQGAAADGQQGHGEAAVEGGHGRVEEVGAGLVAVVRPVQRAGGEQGHEHRE